jgi:excinuclease ABC subunit B
LHGIVPKPIVKSASASDLIKNDDEHKYAKNSEKAIEQKQLNTPKAYIEEEHPLSIAADPVIEYMTAGDIHTQIERLTTEMNSAAKKMQFIDAARLRDEIIYLREKIKSLK